MAQGAKPVLAVDIDDVIFDFGPLYLDRHNKLNGTTITRDEIPSYKIIYFLHNLADHEDQEPYITEFLNWVDEQGIPPHPAVIEALRKLETKYSIIALTARPADAYNASKRWLTSHFPGVFQDIHFIRAREDGTTKLQMCQELGVSIFMDDHPANLKHCDAYATRCLLFGEYPWTNEINLPDKVERVKDWGEVLEVLL